MTFDELAPEELRACCASGAWVRAMMDGRPYADGAAVLDRSAQVLAGLDWADVREAVDAHPRIGERVTGSTVEAAWSRQEQSGMDSASTDVRSALVAANRDYEARYGHVFLIFATGRTDAEMLAAARARLRNSDEEERGVVREELRRIVALRLERLLDS